MYTNIDNDDNKTHKHKIICHYVNTKWLMRLAFAPFTLKSTIHVAILYYTRNMGVIATQRQSYGNTI